MIFEEAVATFEDGVDIVEKAEGGHTYEIGSGKDAVGLFLTEDDAAKDWLTRMEMCAPYRSQVCWVNRPALERYQITLADYRNQHRLVGDRYCISSKFIVMTKPTGTDG